MAITGTCRRFFEIHDLYAEVRARSRESTERLGFEIAREAKERTEQDAARRATFERLVALVGVAFAGPAPVAIGFLGINISG